jgi:hypothetical protein
MVRYKHAVSQGILRRTYNRVFQRHIISIIRTIEFADIPMICIKVLNSFSFKTEPLNYETIRLFVRHSKLSQQEQRALPRIAELFSTTKLDEIPSFIWRVS